MLERSIENNIGSVLESKPQFSLVIPAYNEAARIEPALKDLLLTLDLWSTEGYELFIVMDGCCDGTTETVKGVINDHSNVTTLVFPDRLGKGGAIMEALKYAKGDLVAFIDADGSIPPLELCRLIELAQRYDLVIGSRYEENSNLPKGRPLTRVLLSRAFNILVKLMFWKLYGIKDTQCGAKVFKRRLVNVIGRDLLTTDLAFDVNLIYSALQGGFKVKEVGIIWDEKEGSKLSHALTKQSFAMVFSLLRLRIHYSVLRSILSSKRFENLAGSIYFWLQT
jgi:glycosyltransferase involved in cell wall biosynthesis